MGECDPPVVEAQGRIRLAAWCAIAGILLAVVGVRLALVYEPYTFLIGDCPYYAQAAISLALDGDLDLRNQLKGGLAPHQKQISLGARGEWYPKHPVLMPVLTIPLLTMAGMNAFLIFNIAVLVAFAWTLYELSRSAAGPAAAVAGSLATVFGSFLLFYDYNYSPDLFAGLLLALSVLALLRGRATTGGLLAGLAIFARTSNLLLAPFLIGYAFWKGRLRGATLFAAMLALPLIVQAGLNLAMFDSPLVSPYMRILALEEGQPVLRSHVGDFDNPLWEGIRGQLMDRRMGLVFTAPVLFLAIPGWLIWLRRRPDQAILCLVLAEFVFLIFSRYRWWPTSHLGNRFLMPVLALSAPATACLADWLMERFRGFTNRGADPAPL